MKNKKANINLFLGIAGICALILIIGGVTSESIRANVIKESCDYLGMKYGIYDESTFCINQNNEYHFAKVECVGIFNIECKAELISIGDVRVFGG